MGDLKGGFAPMHDIIWYATKGRRVFTNGRPKSVMAHRRPSPAEDHGHPTCKPAPLIAELIQSIDDGSGGIILDPFAGSGTTAVAAERTGRKWICIEKQPEYYYPAVARIISEVSGQ